MIITSNRAIGSAESWSCLSSFLKSKTLYRSCMVFKFSYRLGLSLIPLNRASSLRKRLSVQLNNIWSARMGDIKLKCVVLIWVRKLFFINYFLYLILIFHNNWNDIHGLWKKKKKKNKTERERMHGNGGFNFSISPDL
jgi:hypothetical protein